MEPGGGGGEGDEISVDSLLKIADWLEVPPATLLNEKAKGPDALVSQIALLLTQYPKLSGAFEVAVSCINQGKASDALLADIVAYATWRISIQEGPNDSTKSGHKGMGG